MLAIAAVYRRAALIRAAVLRAAVSSVASRFVCRGKRAWRRAIRPFEKKPRRFAVGALVRVTKGPFEGMVGTVEVL